MSKQQFVYAQLPLSSKELLALFGIDVVPTSRADSARRLAKREGLAIRQLPNGRGLWVHVDDHRAHALPRAQDE